MQNEKALALESYDDALADPAQVLDLSALGITDGRNGGAQHERIYDPDAVELAAANARAKRFEVEREIRQLRHG
jgi:hypothetical protein